MNCPNCGSEMVQIFAKWVCEDCQMGNQTYYTSKTLTPSLFTFLGFPELKNDTNVVTHHTTIITPPHGDVPDWNTTIIIPHIIENMQNVKINAVCDKMNPLDWTWCRNQICPVNRRSNTTDIKIHLYPISSTSLANNAKFTITVKFKLKA